jgi:phage-related protein
MTSTDTTAVPPVATSAIDTFFASLKADWQVLEADVISVVQNIGAGIEVAAEDLTYCLSWLGSHIGQVAQTVAAVQSSVTALTAAGIPIPAALSSGITQLNDAVAGVNSALSNQAVSSSASAALSDGYNATKALQVVAAQVAIVAAAVQGVTTPTTAISGTPATTPAA